VTGAVIFDVGGVLLVPNGSMIAATLAKAGIAFDESRLLAAHYFAIYEFDSPTPADFLLAYATGYLRALRIPEIQRAEAMSALTALMVLPAIELWSELVPGAKEALSMLSSAGVPTAIVSNSDGTVQASLLRRRLCQVGAGELTPVAAIIDSAIVGWSKPDARIFAPALETLGVDPAEAFYVGDSERIDVAGALAAGVNPVHFDPYSLCRNPAAHEHLDSLGDIASLLS